MKRTVALAVTCSALLTACGPTTHLDLQMRSVGITLPRVLTPAVTIVPPATVTPPAALPPTPPLAPYLPPPATPARPVPPVVVPPVACPQAGQFDVPAKTATPVLEGYPATASYVHKATGAFAEGGTVKPLDGEVSVKVVRLPSSTTAVGQQVDSWRVERRQGSATSVEVYDLVHSSTGDAAIAPGIYLVGLAWDDPERGRLTFAPVGNGLFVLPNPVAVAPEVEGKAAQYAGAATDPQSLTTLSVVRNVLGKKRIDTCGQLVDTYTVDMTGVLVSPSAQYTVAWTLQLATAYGGVDVASTMTLQAPQSGFTWTRSLRSTSVPRASR